AQLVGDDAGACLQRVADVHRPDTHLADEEWLAELVALIDAHLEAVPLIAWDPRVRAVVVELTEVEGRDAHDISVVAGLRAALTTSDRAQRDQVVWVDLLDRAGDVTGKRLQQRARRRLRHGRAVGTLGRVDLGLVDKLPREDGR